MKTKHKIDYRLLFVDATITIPKGTRVIPASNLEQPNDSDIAYWCELWPDMSDAMKSHARMYGFGVSASDVEPGVDPVPALIAMYIELLETVREYESDTFSAPAQKLTRSEAEEITIALIGGSVQNMVNCVSLDGERISDLLESIREN